MILRALRAGVAGLLSCWLPCLLVAVLTIPAVAGPGDVDLSFTNGTGPNGVVFTTKVRTNDNKIYIGGVFDLVNGNTARRIARLSQTGAFDATFATPGCESSVNTITLQPDLKCVIGGDFTSVGNATTRRLARLNDDGSLDTACSQGWPAANLIPGPCCRARRRAKTDRLRRASPCRFRIYRLEFSALGDRP